ncbi:MAG: peptide chain release factor N(5)-glutamine methyltransferase [Candidatus Omnitrophota bacterium]
MDEKEFILTSLLNCNRSDLYTKDIILNNNLKCRLDKILQARRDGEPLQYILGKTEFMSLDFKLTKDTFIPRPETELLVEKSIEIIKSELCQKKKIQILDLCSGSGCIAVSLAKYLPDARLVASDISKATLKIAKLNARLNNVDKKIKFKQSDLFKNLTGRFNFIITNPPYISTLDIKNLQPELSYEPYIALDGGKDGLDFYRKIIKESPKFLKENGILIMEMGFSQHENIKNILKKEAKFEILDIIKDYQGIERIIITKKNG